MIYFIIYVLVGIGFMAWFVYDEDLDIKRSQIGFVLLIGVVWPIVAVVAAWELCELSIRRISGGDGYARWCKWWDQPLRKRRSSRTGADHG